MFQLLSLEQHRSIELSAYRHIAKKQERTEEPNDNTLRSTARVASRGISLRAQEQSCKIMLLNYLNRSGRQVLRFTTSHAGISLLL